MNPISYQERRGQIETYFDRTAVQAWARLTSNAPLGRIRATVRAGRERMRNTLLSWLPADLSGQRVLDACAAPGGKTAQLLERADLDRATESVVDRRIRQRRQLRRQERAIGRELDKTQGRGRLHRHSQLRHPRTQIHSGCGRHDAVRHAAHSGHDPHQSRVRSSCFSAQSRPFAPCSVARVRKRLTSSSRAAVCP